MSGRLVGVVAAVTCALGAAAQDGGFRSGLQPGTRLPRSFEVHTFNGPYADRFHSLVCENDAAPTALFFLREPPEGKDAAAKALLAKLEELAPKYQGKGPGLAVDVVVLSDAAQTSLTNPKEDDPAALVKEATARRAHYARMREWAKDLKAVVLSTAVPAELKGYDLNPKAGLTAVYYEAFTVLENVALAEGTFTEGDIPVVLGRIEARLKARLAPAKKGSKK